MIPIGLDNTRLGHWPWVSLTIAGICVLAFVGTSLSDSGDEVLRARGEAVGYQQQHPWLSAPEIFLKRRGREKEMGKVSPPEGLPATEIRREQEEFDGLVERFIAAEDADPEYRFSMVPARGLFQVGWVTYAFLHVGLSHLFWNLFIFLLLVGPFLEDAWGPAFFAGFYLVGAVVAAAVQAPAMAPEIPLLGASGAISACLGAFALRFAHRRVRVWVLIRGQFFVPAWLYALIGFGADLMGMSLGGRTGGVAYACHVGGFVFGLFTAAVVRATRLEERIAPEGSVPWRRGLDMNRAAEALAGGDLIEARAKLKDSLRKRPGNVEAALELARLEAQAFDPVATTETIEPLLAQRALAGDAKGVRALLKEFGPMLRADRLKAATAYRAAELAGEGDDALVLSLYEAAGAANGSLGAKAFTKAARRLAKADPVRAREMAERAEQLATDPELASRAREVMASLPRPSDASPGPARELRLDPGEGILASDRVQVVWCKVTGLEGASLELLAADGHTARLAPARVELLVAAQLRTLAHGGAERRNGVVVDLVLRAQPGDPRRVLRIAGHEMNLPGLRPGVPPGQVFAELVAGILAEGGGRALPDTAHAQGRPFAQLEDLAAFEIAYYGRPLSDGAPA